VVVSAVIGSAPAGEALEVVHFARAQGLTPRIILMHDGSGRLRLSRDDLAAYRQVSVSSDAPDARPPTIVRS